MWLDVPICVSCWHKQEPQREPHRLLVSSPVECCKCGEQVFSPVYVRAEWPKA